MLGVERHAIFRPPRHGMYALCLLFFPLRPLHAPRAVSFPSPFFVPPFSSFGAEYQLTGPSSSISPRLESRPCARLAIRAAENWFVESAFLTPRIYTEECLRDYDGSSCEERAEKDGKRVFFRGRGSEEGGKSIFSFGQNTRPLAKRYRCEKTDATGYIFRERGLKWHVGIYK